MLQERYLICVAVRIAGSASIAAAIYCCARATDRANISFFSKCSSKRVKMLSRANSTPLTEIASALSERWVFNYIFKSDAIAGISLLTTPQQLQHATTCIRKTSAFERSKNHAGIFNFETREHSFYIPGHTIDGITTGLAVHERTMQRTLPLLPNSRNTVQYTRFVRHESGCIVEVRLDACGDVHISHTTIRSPKRKSVVTLQLERPQLTHEDVANGFSQRAIATITQISKTEYCRSCPVCGVEATTHCSCRILDSRPTHLMDYSKEAANMGVYAGRYEGDSVVEMFRGGEQELQTLLKCKDFVEVKRDDKLRHKLMELCLQHCINSSVEQVLLHQADVVQAPVDRQVVKQEDSVQSLELQYDEVAERLLPPEDGGEYEDDERLREWTEELSPKNEEGDGDRREKNRMSAAKSNLKRKRKNKLLRMNLVILREKVASLRELEGDLKSTNAWLKYQLELRRREETLTQKMDIVGEGAKQNGLDGRVCDGMTVW